MAGNRKTAKEIRSMGCRLEPSTHTDFANNNNYVGHEWTMPNGLKVLIKQ